MDITFLGGAREVGRSAIFLETDKNIMLDYGIKVQSDSKYPMPFQGSIDIMAISHAHLDHSGYVPEAYTKCIPRTLMTEPTKAIWELLIKDTMKIDPDIPYTNKHFKKAKDHVYRVEYEEEYKLGGTKFMMHDAGHISGACITEIEHRGKKLAYSGDFNTEKSMLHEPAKPVEDADYLILESTYGMREHPDRETLKKELYKEVKRVLDNGGNALIPSFAVGRSQEAILMLRDFSYDFDIYLDGMARTAANIIGDYPDYLRDPEAYNNAMRSVKFIKNRGMRDKVLDEPSVIVSTAGMLQGGPAMGYLLNLNERSEIFFTGYCVEGTNGRTLMEEGKVDVSGSELEVTLPVHYFDFSAHAGKSQLIDFVKNCNPSKILCNHGDRCEEFAGDLKGMGFDAVAPKIGEIIKLD